MNIIENETLKVYDKNNPFPAKLVGREVLTKVGSDKETLHFVLDISGSGMSYETGDWIGVYPKNCVEGVERLIEVLGVDGECLVLVGKVGEEMCLRKALRERFSIAEPTRKFLEWVVDRLKDDAERVRVEELLLLGNEEVCKAYLGERDWEELMMDLKSAEVSAQEFVGYLKRLMPRLYSIASSPRKYPNEVHLTITVLRYEVNGRLRKGVASTYLTDRAELGKDEVGVFISQSKFRLPEEKGKDVVMVGPGTGIAPFRGFMQELAESEERGRSCYFLGSRGGRMIFYMRMSGLSMLRRVC